MAVRYYGVNRGQHQTDVVNGTSTNSTDLELAMDLTKNITKLEARILCDMILDQMFKETSPPA